MIAVISPGTDVELVGFVGRHVLVPVGDHLGVETAVKVDARAVLSMPLFRQLSPQDRRLVVELAAAS